MNNCREDGVRMSTVRQSLAKIEGMRRAVILALAICTAAPAQSIVNPNRLRGIIAQLEGAQAGEQALRCDVSAIKPALNFSFRYQAGFMVAVPMNQYIGSGHGWRILTRITPEGGGRTPVCTWCRASRCRRCPRPM